MKNTRSITVAFAADNVLAMPLGVAIASVLNNRAADTQLDIHVFSCGISSRNRKRIASQFRHKDDQLHWHEIVGENAKLLQSLFTASNRPYPPAAYARLLIGRLLNNVDRAIYLDTDVIVTTDLGPLWETPFEDAYLLSVRDLPDSNDHLSRLRNTVSSEDVAKYRLDQDNVYFQSGVLVFDLAKLRESGVDEMIECLRRYPNLTFPDNDALNIVFRHRFKLIDPRWNQMASVYWYESADESPYQAPLFEDLLYNPYIIHFSGRPKPWEENCTHPLSNRWEEALQQSAWQQWTPSSWTRVTDLAQRGRRRLGKSLRRLFS